MRDRRLLEHARAMRREMTAPEKRLWLQLRAKRLGGAKFRRQQEIGRYIADFACRSPMLIVEVDGESHAETAELDEVRTAFFTARGYDVLRFTNAEVTGNLDGVLAIAVVIFIYHSPSPSRFEALSLSPKGERDYRRRGLSLMTIKLHSSFALHPGLWLRAEIARPARLSAKELSEPLQVTRQAASNLLNGDASLSAKTAIRFEKAFGMKADTLMRMQAAHELAEARTREDEIVVEAA